VAAKHAEYLLYQRLDKMASGEVSYVAEFWNSDNCREFAFMLYQFLIYLWQAILETRAKNFKNME